MNKKIILFGVIIILVLIAWIVFLGKKEQKNSLQTPISMTAGKEDSKVVPSETSIEYSDPAGFSFSYPDNLSITNNEISDTSTYSDLQLFAKGVNGSLSLNISDTKLKTLEEWLKSNQITAASEEAKLGSMKAIQVKTSDRLMLAAIDQGILFTIEMPLIEEDFWIKVYQKLISDFSFSSPSQNTSGSTEAATDDVSFEGEEVVE